MSKNVPSFSFKNTIEFFLQTVSREGLTEKEKLRAESVEKEGTSEADMEIEVCSFDFSFKEFSKFLDTFM